MAETSSIGGEGAALIEDGCARNASVELQYHTREGELLVARSRILGVDAERLFLDSPQCIGGEIQFRPRQRIEGYMLLNEVRYAFKSEVLDLRSIVKINEEKRVVGMIIRRPPTVREGQRRTHFRVSLIGQDPIRLEVHPAMPGVTGACPIDASVIPATLVNLSVGGAAIQVSLEDSRTIRVNDLMFMSFHLPDEPSEFYFLVEVRQVWAVPGGTDKRVGVKIKPWPSPRDLSRTQQRLQRYITKVQRARLRPSR